MSNIQSDKTKRMPEHNVKKYSWLMRFFIYCSGADTAWLALCSGKEDTRYFSIGSLVFMTGLFGAISSTFAFYSIIHPDVVTGSVAVVSQRYLAIAACFGLAWGTFIFFLDRAFVSSMSKNIHWGMQLLGAIPRFALAIIISLSISKPLETFLFKEKINQYLLDSKNANTGIKTAADKLEINAVNAIDTNLTAQQQNALTDFNTQSTQEADLNKRITAFDNQISSITKSRQNTINKIAAIRKKVADKDLDAQDAEYQIEPLEAQKKDDNAKIKAIQNQQKPLVEELKKIQKIKTDAYNQATTLIVSRRQSNDLARDSVQHKLDRKAAELDSTNQVYYNTSLINQVLALQDLITYLPDDELKAYLKDTAMAITPLQAATFIETNKQKKNYWLIHLVIWLLFLMIEIAPVTMKLILPKGEYDAVALACDKNIHAVIQPLQERDNSDRQYYYTESGRANKEVLIEYINKVAAARKAEIETLIARWKTENLSFIDLTKSASFRIFNLPLEVIPMEEPIMDNPPGRVKKLGRIIVVALALLAIGGGIFAINHFFFEHGAVLDAFKVPTSTNTLLKADTTHTQSDTSDAKIELQDTVTPKQKIDTLASPPVVAVVDNTKHEKKNQKEKPVTESKKQKDKDKRNKKSDNPDDKKPKGNEDPFKKLKKIYDLIDKLQTQLYTLTTNKPKDAASQDKKNKWERQLKDFYNCLKTFPVTEDEAAQEQFCNLLNSIPTTLTQYPQDKFDSLRTKFSCNKYTPEF